MDTVTFDPTTPATFTASLKPQTIYRDFEGDYFYLDAAGELRLAIAFSRIAPHFDPIFVVPTSHLPKAGTELFVVMTTDGPVTRDDLAVAADIDREFAHAAGVEFPIMTDAK
jgi:hypothetical protein